jgi:putative SOS response-associated peptidase YedK
MKSRAEVAKLARAMSDRNNNQPPMPGVSPDYPAPVVVTTEDGSREMRNMRWGMPTSKQALFKAATERADKLRAKGTAFDFADLLKMEPDKGVILTEEAEWDLWMSGAPWDEVKHLQRPLPEGALKVVATGSRQDDVLPALA